MNAAIDHKTKILHYLQEQFRHNLWAVVLFGSRARQTERAFSDIDLLLIIDGLPQKRRKHRQLAASIRRALALPIDATVLSPNAFVASVRYCAPLMIELACAHEVWFEKDSFFSNQLQFIHSLMRQNKLIQLQPGVWKLPEEIDEIATDGVLVPA
jgi:predicted nucleotidyltransferase